MFDQFALGFEGRFGVVGQSDAVGYAEDMRIDRHGRLVEGNGQHHIGGFPPHAGNG